MTGIIPVNQLGSYTPSGTMLRDIAAVVGDRINLTEDEASIAVDRCGRIVKARKAIKKLGGAIMTCPAAPHNVMKDDPAFQAINHLAYFGTRVGETLHLKAAVLSRVPKSPYDAVVPLCVIDPRGFLVYYVHRSEEPGSANRWVCVPHEGQSAMYGDIYHSLAIFTVALPVK